MRWRPLSYQSMESQWWLTENRPGKCTYYDGYVIHTDICQYQDFCINCFFSHTHTQIHTLVYTHTCSINVKGLGLGTDIQPLAVQIITSCELIQPARLPEVEQLLAYLQKRKANSSLTEFDGKSTYRLSFVLFKESFRINIIWFCRSRCVGRLFQKAPKAGGGPTRCKLIASFL